MSMSNKKTAGSKGTNAPFQFSVLNGLQEVADNTNGVGGTLLSILNAVRAHQDMEILLVRDNGVVGSPVIQQIREYDETTDVWTTNYTDVSGAAYTPIGPLEYLDSSAALNLILAELVTQTSILTNIASIISGNVESSSDIEDLYAAGVNETGVTVPGVKSYSILFEGSGGSINGVSVKSGFILKRSASFANTLDSLNYVIPTTPDPFFGSTPRVFISYTM